MNLILLLLLNFVILPFIPLELEVVFLNCLPIRISKYKSKDGKIMYPYINSFVNADSDFIYKFDVKDRSNIDNKSYFIEMINELIDLFKEIVIPKKRDNKTFQVLSDLC